MVVEPVKTVRGRFIVVGLLLIAAALVWRAWVFRDVEPVPERRAADATGAGLRPITLWFASPDGENLVMEPRQLPEEYSLHARVAVVVAALAQGPREGGTRTLPEGTQVLHAYLDDSGLLTLDLSRAFRQGFPGGARAEEMTLASLVRTIAANVPEVRRIRIVCAGAAVPSLGGHFPLDQPLDLDEWP